jgi:hypothetical protein
MAKTICRILGFGFILVGIAGLLKPDLLGMHLTPVHNGIHFLSGALSLYFGFAGSMEAARSFCLAFGSVYAALGVLGFVAPSLVETLLHAEARPTESMGSSAKDLAPDNIAHIILGGLFLAGAFIQSAPRSRAPEHRYPVTTSPDRPV